MGKVVRDAIQAARAKLLFLPSYNPDFNPIHKAFSKPKALLRNAAERTVEGLWAATSRFLDAFTSQECATFLAATGKILSDREPP